MCRAPTRGGDCVFEDIIPYVDRLEGGKLAKRLNQGLAFLGVCLIVCICSIESCHASRIEQFFDTLIGHFKPAAVSDPCAQSTQLPRPVPHLAKYRITLAHVSTQEDITEVNGWVTIKIYDTGDGWSYEQNANLMIYNSFGESEDVGINVACWQNYAGTYYAFNTRTLRNHEEEIFLKGHATIDCAQKIGEVTYVHSFATGDDVVLKESMRIPMETLFPLHHLLHLLKAAQEGQRVTSYTVFDGSNETQRPVTVDTVITRSRAPRLVIKSAQVDRLPQSEKQWCMHMAVYPENSQGTAEAEYSMEQHVLDIGIIKEMTMDFGAFKARATIEAIDLFI